MAKTKKPKRPFPTQCRLHELLERKYDSEGKLYFVAKVKRGTKVKVGDVLYGCETTYHKGLRSEHTRFKLTIDDHSQTMAVWNRIFQYGDYDRDIFTVDHEDQNPVNDHHTNLRLATKSEQNKNKGRYKKSGSSSIYHGVYFDKNANKWIVRYQDKDTGKLIYRGCYTTEIEAAQAFDLASWQDDKDVKSLNFPDQVEISKRYYENEGE